MSFPTTQVLSPSNHAFLPDMGRMFHRAVQSSFEASPAAEQYTH